MSNILIRKTAEQILHGFAFHPKSLKGIRGIFNAKKIKSKLQQIERKEKKLSQLEEKIRNLREEKNLLYEELNEMNKKDISLAKAHLNGEEEILKDFLLGE